MKKAKKERCADKSKAAHYSTAKANKIETF